MGYCDSPRTTHFHPVGRSHSHHYRRHSDNSPDVYPLSKSHSEHRRLALNSTDLLHGTNNRGLEQHSGHVNVWRWLSETGGRENHHWSDEESGRNRTKKSRHCDHSNNATRPEIRTWLPLHITTATNEALPSIPPASNRKRRSRRQRSTSVDSSIISRFQACRDHPEKGGTAIPAFEYSIASEKSNDELFVPQNSSPPIPHAAGSHQFEKRPRHKTREDKYDSKKRKRNISQESSEESRSKVRRKPEKKKKAIGSSKNVMNNFTSEAVINDRITIQPSLKPGLFDNGRVSRRKPVSDLAFSEMQFLQHQKRNSQPKQLSKSRLKERQRESRELEEVSAFFLPPKANENRRGYADPMFLSEHRNRQGDLRSRYKHSEPANARHEVVPKHHDDSASSRGLVSRESNLANCDLTHTVTEPSKATTYLTWSRSETSPLNQVPDGPRSSPLDPPSEWSITPNSIRKALIATGIYQDTGIHPYDDPPIGKTGSEHTTQEAGRSRKHIQTSEHSHYRKQVSDMHPKRDYRDQAVMTDTRRDLVETHQSQGETAISDVLEAGHRGERRQANYDEHPQQLPPSNEGVNSGRNTREIRLPSIQTSMVRKATKIGSTDETPTYLGVEPTDQEAGNSQKLRIQSPEDRVSQSSREAMPPPPLPFDRRHIHPVSLTSHAPVEDRLIQDNTIEASSQRPLVNKSPKDDHVGIGSAPPIRPSIPVEESVCPPESDSWISQARTPSALGVNRQGTFSRLSMMSPLYQSQLDENLSSNLQRRDKPESNLEETMSDFIARIEEEMEDQAYLQSMGSIEEETSVHETVGGSLHYVMGSQQDQYPGQAMEYEDEDDGYLEALINPEGTSHRVGQSQGSETRLIRPSLSKSTATAEVVDSLEDEQREMSSFWKPNRFSYF